ncbi:MAG: hypothetical protein V5A34_01080 [Halapricum sp.]
MRTGSLAVATGVGSLVVLLTLAVPAAAHGGGQGGMGGFVGGSAAMSGTVGGAGLGTLLWLVVIVAVAALGFGNLRSDSTPPSERTDETRGQTGAMGTVNRGR